MSIKRLPRKSDVRALYDSFKVKDMSFREFKRALGRVSDPELMERDLNRVQTQRAVQRSVGGMFRN